MEKSLEETLLKAIVVHGVKIEHDCTVVDVSSLKRFLHTMQFTCMEDGQDYLVHNYRSPGYRQNTLTLILFNQNGTIVKVSCPEADNCYA